MPPATFTSPTRALEDAFGVTVSPTAPVALPEWPDTIAIHDAELAALQLHPDSVVTPTDSEPPVAPMVSVVRLSE